MFKEEVCKLYDNANTYCNDFDDKYQFLARYRQCIYTETCRTTKEGIYPLCDKSCKEDPRIWNNFGADKTLYNYGQCTNDVLRRNNPYSYACRKKCYKRTINPQTTCSALMTTRMINSIADVQGSMLMTLCNVAYPYFGIRQNCDSLVQIGTIVGSAVAGPGALTAAVLQEIVKQARASVWSGATEMCGLMPPNSYAGQSFVSVATYLGQRSLPDDEESDNRAGDMGRNSRLESRQALAVSRNVANLKSNTWKAAKWNVADQDQFNKQTNQEKMPYNVVAHMYGLANSFCNLDAEIKRYISVDLRTGLGC